MTLYETPDNCFARLTKDAGNKFVIALERVKDACDKLDEVGAELTYSAIGKMAVSLHGGPKAQSILNNSKHKEYIDSRKNAKRATKAKPIQENDLYPASDLDQRTRRYIDDLRQRNRLLENTMKELKQRIKVETTQQPVDVSNLIGSELQKTPVFSLSENTVSELENLLSALPEITNGLELFEGCSLRYRSGDWALSPPAYREIMELLKKAGK